jgi:hypothetical protein
MSALLLVAVPLSVEGAGASAASWHVVQTPALRSGFAGRLTGVSCPATTSCFAVGGTSNPDGEGVGPGGRYLLHWNGTAWSVVITPAPAGDGGEFLAVSCSATNACTAVGEYDNSAERNRALIERWNGHTWSLQSSPVPPSGDAVLYTVDCPSTTSCFAAGQTSHLNTALMEHWDGHTWTLQTVPHSIASREYEYYGLACTAVDACIAAGGTFDGSASTDAVPLIDRWNGHNWIQQTPASLPAGRIGSFQAVSCASAAMCLAVGSTTTTQLNSPSRRLVQQWNGHSWAVVNTPAPAAPGANYFAAVSCPTARACVVAGDADSQSVNVAPLAERWNGATWSVDQTVAAGPYTFFDGITCTAALACNVVGAGSEGGDGAPLIEHTP